MTVAEKTRPPRPLSALEEALMTVLNESAAAAESQFVENNDLRADRQAYRLTLEVLADGVRKVRDDFALQLPAVVPFVQETLDELSRLEELGRRVLAHQRTVAGVRAATSPLDGIPAATGAGEGSESEARVEESRSAGDAASTLAPGDLPTQAQRVRGALEVVLGGGA